MTSTVPHQALYRVWRAQTFAGIVGQEATVAVLRNAVRTDSVAHALLFVGPRGTGKTSMARIVAKALNCTDLRDGEPCDRCAACVAIREGRSLDVVEMDAASNNKVEDMRELLPRIATSPSDLRRKVFIIDEVQRITQGWDVLLKTLEEPPDHVAFVFCTTDAGQIRPAILSRVQRFDFRKLTVEQIAGKLHRILEDIGREADDDAVELLARLAAGGMRDAESMLDQLLSGDAERLTSERVREVLGLAREDTVEGFLAAVASGDALTGMTILDELEERGRDLRAFLDQLFEAIRLALVAGLTSKPARPSIAPAELAAVGRRLSSIDPSRLGPGGIRFQLDLALLERAASADTSAADTARVMSPATPARVEAYPSPRPPVVPTEPAAIPPAEVAPARATPADAGTAAPRPNRSPPPAEERRPAAPATPPAPRPTAEDASPNGGTAPLSLVDLENQWPEVVADLSQQPAVKPLIVACRLVAVDDRVVTLGFPENQAFLKDLLERRRSTVEEGIARHAGMPVSVRFVATNIESPATTGDGDGERLLSEARRIFADDLADVGEVS